MDAAIHRESVWISTASPDKCRASVFARRGTTGRLAAWKKRKTITAAMVAATYEIGPHQRCLCKNSAAFTNRFETHPSGTWVNDEAFEEFSEPAGAAGQVAAV